jgi:hypothetical protein
LEARSARVLACVAATVALGGTFWNGHWAWQATDQGFAQAITCLACLLLSLFAAPFSSPKLAHTLTRAQPLVFAAGFAFFFSILLRARPNVAAYVSLMMSAALLIALGLTGKPALGRLRVPLIIAVFCALGIWRIHTAPAPKIDVWIWHNEAIEALFHGKNPYAVSMPNPFPDARYYDPSMVVGGRVLTGYQYPPLSLLFAIPGYLLGDYRYSMLIAIATAGAFMAYTRKSRLGATAMSLWLFSPGTLFILQYGYTESMIVALLSWTLWSSVHRPRWLFVPLGLLLASKQYMFVMVAPLLGLLHGDASALPPSRELDTPRSLLLRATALGAAITAPWFAINPSAFFHSLVVMQLRQPFRPESLSVLGFWATHFGQRLPTWLGFASLLPTCALALARCERSPAGFAQALSLVSFVFFFLSKQAFANYYFFTLGAICCAVALTERTRVVVGEASVG